MRTIQIDFAKQGIFVNGSFVAMASEAGAVNWCLNNVYEEWELWDGNNLIANQIDELNRALSILNDFIFRPYVSDLNAMSILENKLDEDQALRYRDFVVRVLGDCAWYQSAKIMNVPARIRAIAMFKTLKNK